MPDIIGSINVNGFVLVVLMFLSDQCNLEHTDGQSNGHPKISPPLACFFCGD